MIITSSAAKRVLTLGLFTCLVWCCPRPLADGQPTQRHQLLDAMRARPDDLWPRGQGHVVLAWPGSPESDKAYCEPGGSFSPGFASFGISIWVTQGEGRILASSDTIPLEQVHQEFIQASPKELPQIRTETPYYTAIWSGPSPGTWQLALQARTTNQLVLVVRSAGPSGGPLDTLEWDGKKLEVNHRWNVTLSSKVKDVQVGAERSAKAPEPTRGHESWTSDKGWGYARLPLASSMLWRVTVQDTAVNGPSPLANLPMHSALGFNLPEPEFVSCIEAQVDHLLMGLVGNETRPGEPNNYPLNWLRDGSYQIVALARAGRLDVARKLCEPFGEHDFFGGFGAEADGPGLAIWALWEVASETMDKGFAEWAWPHVQRKARLIEDMLGATGPIHHSYAGPIVPKHRDRQDLDLVCDAAKDGLIIGRMDLHRPVLFVNAVSYHGLRAAASLAHLTGHQDDAARWEKEAAALRLAWNQALASGTYENERNFICGIYPTSVVSDTESYRRKLMDFSTGSHDVAGQIKGAPLWTYFNLAAAHQWLALGEMDRVWRDLHWFWDHQVSPGLFTWWEGNGEENSFGRWETMSRGWPHPAHVTPHYWTAAEMLLLQLDMLVYVEESGTEPVLVVGAGVPAEWLTHQLTVSGINTSIGRVSWRFGDGKLEVSLRGTRHPVRLGPAFPKNTILVLN